MIGPPGNKGVKSDAMSALNFVPSAGGLMWYQCISIEVLTLLAAS
jgi:hypothetical protein